MPPVATPTARKVRKLYRAMPAVSTRESVDNDDEVYRVSMSSEAPVLVWDDELGRVVYEVLAHTPGALDRTYLERGIAGLVDHNSRDQVSILRNWRINKDRMLEFDETYSLSQRAQDIKSDVERGIRPYVSIGYALTGKTKVLDPGNDKTPPTVLRTKWMPMEGSHVAIPADVRPGPNRSAEFIEVEVDDTGDGETVVEVRGMDPVTTGQGGQGGETVAPSAGVETRSAGAAVVELRADGAIEAMAQAAEIAALAEAHGHSDKVAGWLRNKTPLADVQKVILEAKRTQATTQPAPDALANISPKEVRQYSYARAIARAADGKLDGYEAEVHQELCRLLPNGQPRNPNGIIVPMRDPGRAQRALSSNTATKGVETVFDEPGDLIELLRNKAMVIRSGARVLTGLQGPIGFPKQTGAMTITWVAENPGADVALSDIAFGLVTLAPKTMQGSTQYTRQLLAQSVIDIEALVREDLAIGHALAIDRAAIHGLGGSEPQGVYAVVGVNTEAIAGAVTFIDLINMTASVADDNADLGSLAFLTTPLAASRMQTILEFPGTVPPPIWTGTLQDGRIAGYPAHATNQVSKTMVGVLPTGGTSHGIVYGNWNDMIIGLWQSMELVVDPYTLARRGMIQVTSFQMGDLILRHPESFAIGTGMTVA